MTWLLIAAGAALGAPLRYMVDRLVQRRHESVYPWGTLVVNVAGSFALGVLAGLAMDGRAGDNTIAILGIGFCGAFTTYSTFSYETIQLFTEGARRYALANLGANVVASVLAAAAGWLLVS